MIYQRAHRVATEEPVFSARPGAAHLFLRSDKERSMKKRSLWTFTSTSQQE